MAVDAKAAVPEWLLAEILQDKVFGEKYQVECELGFGAAGVVVGALHRVLEQRVAIKFLRSGQENPDAVARFLTEARAASRIRNQHVVRIVDASTLASGIPFLVMEHLDGVDLERMLHQSPHRQLPIKDAIDLILQTCEALAECHCAGIVHRDLKPSNLFCVHGADGLPMIKVLDFGIAKLGTTTSEAELQGSAPGSAPLRRVFGSPAYMSPEQFESSTAVDLRSDIWAIGVILYEFVTGEVPFQETSIYRIRKRVTEDQPRSIRELRRDAPSTLEPIILKCLEKEPSKRYATLAELGKALLPFASLRARDSVARIVRTVEAPGSDTSSLDLSSGGRVSASPMARTIGIARNSSHRARFVAFVAVAAVVAGVTGIRALDAWRPRAPSAVPLLLAPPTFEPKVVGISALTETDASTPAPGSARATEQALIAPTSASSTVRNAMISSARSQPHIAAPPSPSPVQPSSPASAESAASPPPSAPVDSAQVVLDPGAAGAPATSASNGRAGSPGWLEPIIVKRKRSP